MKKIYLCICLCSISCFFGQGNYCAENFEYTAGSLVSTNGWYTHSGTANPIAVTTPGLTWASYVGSGVGNAALVNNTGADVNKPLIGNISNGSVYASFLCKASATIASAATGDYFFHFCKYTNEVTPDYAALNSAFRARVFVLKGTNATTQFKLGLTFNDSNYNATSGVTADLDITKTYLVVVKYKFVDGLANDTVSLFVFAEGGAISTEPTTPTVGPLTATTTGTAPNVVIAEDLTVIQGVALRQNTLGQNVIVDGIYVRNQWDLTSAGTILKTDSFVQNNTLKVYPNPTANKCVFIDSVFEGTKEKTLFDLNGNTILKNISTTNELDLSNINKGVYLLQTKIGANTSVTKLIIN